MTNYEKMTKDMETLMKDTTSLANLIVQICGNYCCNFCSLRFENCLVNCEEGVKEWLEQEVEEDGSN